MQYQWDESSKTLTVTSDDPNVESTQTIHQNDAVHIRIRGSIKKLGNFIFSNYTNVETIEFPDSIEELGNNVITFSLITEIRLPFQLKTVEPLGPFEYNYKLEKYIINPNHANFKVIDGVLYSRDMTKIISIPPNWNSKIFTVPYGVITIFCSATDCLQNIEQLIFPQTVSYIEGILFKPKVIKKFIIYRKVNSQDQITWAQTIDDFANSSVQKNDIKYVYSNVYSTYFKENKTAVVSTTNNNNKYEYSDNILSHDTNINTIIYPKSVDKISSSCFKPMSHNSFYIQDFTGYTTITIKNHLYTTYCSNYLSIHFSLSFILLL
ncbi:hypothetical protein TVAG_225640 [Trichomonas vaginalis G3]|uniref:Surface antigen BspA-like n=1 Tax=Trichomonas vaginalis (strain ATCC PRA-98 / G3) TaxID=412133 RepID=A2DNU3_TRIV3|nr:ribonuclease inhibitor domain-containing protein [Trichomonas vaginalis G3]EAY17938.1 hypothetical protein TVAG_225640 [Trichomonas vaginalis G3]KAI5527120.1 ribonuclease inhibitor domain-containing protein [Trichomonas vaginalis G3]|eukprot:XP_001578924.1 hypothetical protein [Trichomonas vaginalis G3]